MGYFSKTTAIDVMAAELVENLIQAELITSAEEADEVFGMYVAELSGMVNY